MRDHFTFKLTPIRIITLLLLSVVALKYFRLPIVFIGAPIADQLWLSSPLLKLNRTHTSPYITFLTVFSSMLEEVLLLLILQGLELQLEITFSISPRFILLVCLTVHYFPIPIASIRFLFSISFKYDSTSFFMITTCSMLMYYFLALNFA